MPNDVLEMSFYKFVEQFFYNKKISVSAARVQEPLAGEPRCPHSLFRYCELIFRFGTIKTTIKFEKQDAYTLDLLHFGLKKGNVSKE